MSGTNPKPSPGVAPRGVTLIGMPGAGKSTVGVVLAKRLVLDFVDSDLLIQHDAGVPLQSVLDRDGYLALRQREAQILLSIDARRAVVATGGSAVYSANAMAHLGSQSTVVYLEVPLAVISSRIGDYSGRGIAKPPDHSLSDTYYERTALYRRFADMTVDADQAVENVVDVIARRIASTG